MIKIGNIELENNVILAPMSGVTDAPFRRLVKSFGAPMVVSEMIASHSAIRKTKESIRKSQSHIDEFPMAVQLAGCDPEIMAEAAKINQDIGASIIDINYGCPVKKVVSGNAGSAMMRDEPHAVKVLDAVVKAVNIPVTLKMRTGWDDNHRNAPSLAKKAQDVGIQMITIHGRTRCQFYKGKSDWKFIKKVVDAVTIPVIANGDINNLDDAKQCLNDSHADGVMVGRGVYGKPWFLNQVSQYLKNNTLVDSPPLEQQKDIILNHYDAMLEHYGQEGGVRFARKHIGWYSAGLAKSAEFRHIVMRETQGSTVRRMIEDFYGTIAC